MSPALRSRFTEVWVPNAKTREDLRVIITEVFANSGLPVEVQMLTDPIIDFIYFIEQESDLVCLNRLEISIREVLAWANYIITTSVGSSCSSSLSPYDLALSYIHGAYLSILDGVGAGVNVPRDIVVSLKAKAIHFLLSQCPAESQGLLREVFLSPRKISSILNGEAAGSFIISGFTVPAGPHPSIINAGYIINSYVFLTFCH